MERTPTIFLTAGRTEATHIGATHLGVVEILRLPFELGELLASVERALGPEHTLVAIAALDLGELERREGHFDRARPLLERAGEIYGNQIVRAGSIDAVYSPFNYVEALQSRGLVDEAQGRLNEAVVHLGQAGELSRRGAGYADPSADYARFLRKVGRTADAANVEASAKDAAPGTHASDGTVPRLWPSPPSL